MRMHNVVDALSDHDVDGTGKFVSDFFDMVVIAWAIGLAFVIGVQHLLSGHRSVTGKYTRCTGSVPRSRVYEHASQ